ncbi:MAG: transcription termination/antitermination protein NusA, partial [Clostridiales bacterium]|nr:transcription termination/antitermination protein NusA [Clostridiales bacterium]
NINILLEAIEAALVSAYKRNFGTSQNVRVDMDRESGNVRVFSLRKVVDELEDEFLEISLEDARQIDKNYKLGDFIEREVTPKNFGRIAAQNAKQVVVQRIREAERSSIYEKFQEQEHEVINGIVQRVEARNVFIDLDKTEGILPLSEQIPNEEYRVNDRIKVYVAEVKKTTRRPQITLSRTHPDLVKRLFEIEVPEIVQGDVIIKNIAREAGSRTKMAVYSLDNRIDSVGACVGHRGSRVHQIVDELRGEKIDIVKWSEDPEEYIANALSPSEVLDVYINKEDKSAQIIVPDDQLSLAIGKEGQNARLAARLTGWRIDIKSESQI